MINYFKKTFAIALTAAVLPAVADITSGDKVNSTNACGLYYISQAGSGQAMQTDKLEVINVASKADLAIHEAHISSEDNANTTFAVRLEIDNFATDPKTSLPVKPVALRVGDHAYSASGWAGAHGSNSTIFFTIHGKGLAEAAAKGLSVECVLRSPPGYKLLAEFIPAKTEFQTNDPIQVKFVLKNLDDRTIAFQRGGQQRGSRDNQYGFRAMLFGSPGTKLPIQPVPDVGNPVNFGGLCGVVNVEPGKTFDDTIDLKKWFAFDRPGTYQIHGFYALAFYPSGKTGASIGRNLQWTDYASADFSIVIK